MAPTDTSHRAIAADDVAPPALDLVFWPGVLGSLAFSDQLLIAQAGAFTSIAISPLTIRQLTQAGVSISLMQRQAQDRGLRISRLDGMSSWAPVWLPAPSHPTYERYRARFDFSATECLDMSVSLGIDSMVAVAMYEPGSIPASDLAGSLADFCALAAREGIRVELECIPYTGMNTLAGAWDLLKRANAANGGLMIDTWHLCKSASDLAEDLRLIESLPRGAVTSMQLVDARSSARTSDPYAELLRDGRGFPGDGELPIACVISALTKNGCLTNAGPEPSSAAYLDLPLGEIGRLAGRATRDVLRAAGVPLA